MRRIRSLAEQGDFSLKSFTPGTLSDKEFFSEWPINVHIEGTYHNLALFFDRISRFSRIINIEDLEIRELPAKATVGPKDANAALQHTITSSFTAKTFVYKEPEKETPADARSAKPGSPAAKGAPPAADGEGPASRIRSGGAPAGGPD